MSEFESEQNLLNPKLNSSEKVTDVNTAKKLEGEPTSEELENIKAEKGKEQEAEKPGLSPEEQIRNLESEAEARQQEITRLAESIEGTKSKLKEVYDKLGLPPTKEDSPSVSSEKDKLEKLKAEQETLGKQKKELIGQSEKKTEVADSSKSEKENVLIKKAKEDELLAQDINVGDEVYWQGGKWRVHTAVKPNLSYESDTDFNYRMLAGDKDPNKEPRRIERYPGGLTLVSTNGIGRSFQGGPTFDDVVKITPENREKIDKLIKELEK